ncbi:MAG: hypothetical protein IPI73_17750 [Betaproteobacteria bacterium]|nr:hypothetical protein [Betaproteobacteria bacterium]
MKKRLLAVVGLFGLFVTSGLFAQATTYTYTGVAYSGISNFSACATGPCRNYSAGARITGQFTTAAPLAANLAVGNILPQVTSYAFSDGLVTLASTDPVVRANVINIQAWRSDQAARGDGRGAQMGIHAPQRQYDQQCRPLHGRHVVIYRRGGYLPGVRRRHTSTSSTPRLFGVWTIGRPIATYSGVLSGADENPTGDSAGTGHTHVTLDTLAHASRVAVVQRPDVRTRPLRLHPLLRRRPAMPGSPRACPHSRGFR